jgi:hypothetical protein
MGTGTTPWGWCAPASIVRSDRVGRKAAAIRREALGYVATMAFLVAHAMTVAGAVPLLRAALNMGGALAAATYLYRKRAVPSVISNLVWVVITLVGLIVSGQA